MMLDFTTNQTLQLYAWLLDKRDKHEKGELKYCIYNWKAVKVFDQLKLEL